MAKRNTNFDLTIQVNGKEVKNTLNGVGKELRSLRARTKNLTEGTEEWEKVQRELAKTEKIYDGMKKRQREVLEETKKNIDAQEDHNRSLEDFTDGFSQMFNGVKNGDFMAVKEGFNGVQAGIKGATRAAMGFIATPIGAALTALTALFLAGREIFQFNQRITKMNKKLRALGVEAENLNKVRDSIKATAETFNQDFNQLAKTTASLARSFNISIDQADKALARGLADGGRENENFLESLSEYDEFFASAGFAAQDFIDVVNTGFELGIYTDKLPDAIKEADISLREQTTATKDALVNAFGASFTDDILSRVDKGAITTKEALEEIAAEAEKSQISQQEAAQLTADVFRGAGEDAGGAIKIFKAFGEAANRELDSVAQSEMELKEANEELNQVQTELFGISGFGEMWVKIKTIAVQAITALLNFFKFRINLMITGAELLLNAFVSFGNGVITFVQQFAKRASPVLRTMGVDAEKLVNTLEKIKKEDIKFGRLGAGSEEQGDNEQKIDTSTRPQVNEEAKTQKQKEAEKRRQEELAQIRERYRKLEREREAESDIELLQQKKATAIKEAEQLNASEATLQMIRDEWDAKIEEKRKEKEKKRLEQIRAFEQRKRELENEIELENAESEQEKREIKEEQRFEREQQRIMQMKLTKDQEHELLEKLELQHQKKLESIRDKGNRQRLEQELKFKHQLKQAELDLTMTKLNAMRTVLGSLRGFFSESSGIYKAMFAVEKALAIGQVFTNMSKTIAQAQLNNAMIPPLIPPGVPNPAKPVSLAAMAKTIAGAKITAAAQTASIAAQTIQGFDQGGYTDTFGLGYRDGSGEEVAGVVHKDEYVVPKFLRSDPTVPPILDYLESKRKQKVSGYNTGGSVTAPQGTTSTSISGQQVEKFNVLLDKMMKKLSEPISANVLYGMDAEIERQKQEEKLRRIQNNNKVKKK